MCITSIDAPAPSRAIRDVAQPTLLCEHWAIVLIRNRFQEAFNRFITIISFVVQERKSFTSESDLLRNEAITKRLTFKSIFILTTRFFTVAH